MVTTNSANAQYYSRPADERFKSLADLHAIASVDMARCGSKDLQLSSLKAVSYNGSVALQSLETGVTAGLTHWSGSQLARFASAPAGYLRTLPAELAADCLNHGLQTGPTDQDPSLQAYFRKSPDGLTLRALTSTDYSRLYDAKVVERLQRLQTVRPSLDLPPVWEGGKGGAYRGDRDMFVIMVDGGSIVDDPTLGGFGGSNGTMYRGIIVRNSEVGAATYEMLTFLFRGICGNHNIWGVENASHVRRRHVGKIDQVFETMNQTAIEFFDRPASDDVQRIKQLAAIELGRDRETVVTAGRGLGLTETQADAAYTSAETHEPNPRSVWGYMQGITRISQESSYQDDRFALDLLAAKLARRFAVAA